MRLPVLILVHIATAHRVDLDLTATTGEGSNTSSIAATALQNSTAVVGTHGSDGGVLSRAGPGIPGKLMQRLALILAASSVLGGPLPAVEAKAMPTAFVAPGVRRDALSGSGFRPSAMEAAGPGSGVPDPSCRGSFMDEAMKRVTADLAQASLTLEAESKVAADESKFMLEAEYQAYRDADEYQVDFLLNNVGGDAMPLLMVEKAYVLLKKLILPRAFYQSFREELDDFVLNSVDVEPRTRIEEANVFLKLLKEGRRLSIERRDAEAAADGMTKEQEAEYQSYREALEEFLTTFGTYRSVMEEADVLLKLLKEGRRLSIEGRRDAEVAAVAPIDADLTKANPTQDTSFSVAEAAPVDAAWSRGPAGWKIDCSEAAPTEAGRTEANRREKDTPAVVEKGDSMHEMDNEDDQPTN